MRYEYKFPQCVASYFMDIALIASTAEILMTVIVGDLGNAFTLC